MADRESFKAMISERQIEAEAALIRGDVGPRLAMWSHNDPVSLIGAVGVSKSGWDELLPTFRAVASRLSGGHDVTYEILSFDIGADTAWIAGFLRFVASMDDAPARSFTLRATTIFRREDGEWKAVHEHTDFQDE